MPGRRRACPRGAPRAALTAMCVGIPVQVLETNGAWARCTGREGEAHVDLSIVGEQPAGTWLLAFAGAARQVLTEEAARAIDAALDALAAALAGDEAGIRAGFADLIERSPTLPDHLAAKGP